MIMLNEPLMKFLDYNLKRSSTNFHLTSLSLTESLAHFPYGQSEKGICLWFAERLRS